MSVSRLTPSASTGTGNHAAISSPLAMVKPSSNERGVFTHQFMILGDIMFLTRGHFLSNCSPGRKKSIQKQKSETGVRANNKVQQEEKRRKHRVAQGIQGTSDTSLKCRMRASAEMSLQGSLYRSLTLHSPGHLHALHYVPGRKLASLNADQLRKTKEKIAGVDP